MDDPDEMFQLADLLEGVSVDCAELPSETHSPGSPGINNLIVTYRILCKHYFICSYPSSENKFFFLHSQTFFFPLKIQDFLYCH